jgi:hypothetical protein
MEEKQTGNGPVGSETSAKLLAVDWQADEATSVEIRNPTEVTSPVATPNHPDRWPFLRFSDSSLSA